MLREEMAAAASRFTCFALDTPGFGGSDPLPGDTLTIGDLADATGAAIRALGLPPCFVYGTHTGALIATELGAGWPDLVSGVIAEGLPIFTEEEIAAIFDPSYFSTLVTDPLGSHLTATWVRFRDQFTWFPWLSRDVTRLNPVDRPLPEEIDHWVTMYYRSCRTYAAAYRAACFHGHRAYLAAAALDVPAVFMASAEDMLYPHLDRLPALKPGQRIERLPHDPPAKYRAIADYAASLPSGGNAPADEPAPPVGCDPAVQFVDTNDGQLLIRCYGDADAPALILLHDAPGSGLALEPVARALSVRHFVVLPDLPGCGESDDCAGDVLAAAWSCVPVIADWLRLDRFALAAIGCGCAVAAQVADTRVSAIYLQDVPAPDLAIAAQIAPDIELTPEGSHWLKAWLLVRDGQIYSPWFDGRVAAQRPTQGNFDADWLHDQTFEIMKARASYHRLPREAWAFDTEAALACSRVPVHRARPDGIVPLLTSHGVYA